jgi:hypothetical protein
LFGARINRIVKYSITHRTERNGRMNRVLRRWSMVLTRVHKGSYPTVTMTSVTAAAPSATATTTTTSTTDQATSKDPRKAVLHLLGSQLLCTLRDGRKARGTLVCVDRL